MAKSTRNEFEFMSMVLDALGVEYEEADIKQRERWRGKVLDGWGVDYVVDDLKQFARWRQKCLEGLAKNSGGGGDSDFTTAQVTITNISIDRKTVICPIAVDIDNDSFAYGATSLATNETSIVTMALYKGKGIVSTIAGSGAISAVTGDIVLDGARAIVTGDGSITITSGIS